jgi:hypothetical protein
VVHIHHDSIAKEGNHNINSYITTPKKQLQESRRHETSLVEQDRRLNSVNARRNYYEVKTTNTILSSGKPGDAANEDSSQLYSYKGGVNSKPENMDHTNSIVTQVTNVNSNKMNPAKTNISSKATSPTRQRKETSQNSKKL